MATYLKKATQLSEPEKCVQSLLNSNCLSLYVCNILLYHPITGPTTAIMCEKCPWLYLLRSLHWHHFSSHAI